jgi:chromosomal replication initiation ATPase DnaA
METKIYARQLEKKLIDDFKAQFFKKMGYYPLVVTKINTDNDEYLPIISLQNLEEIFYPFLPVKLNSKVPLSSNRRYREVVELRNIFCAIARMMKYTTTYIGEYLGHRDHTTLLMTLLKRVASLEKNTYK